MVQKSSEKLQGKVLLGKLVTLLFVFLSFGKLIDKVVASVNGEPILESELKVATLYYGSNNREKLLEKLIEINLLYQFLSSRGISIPDEKLDEIILQVAKVNGKSVEEFAKELKDYGLTLKDFKDFIKKNLVATEGVKAFLLRQIEVSEIELELEKLKKGKVKTKKKIEVAVIPKEKAVEVEKFIEKGNLNLKEIAQNLGGFYNVMTVEKGELKKSIESKVWRARKGDIIFDEDEKNLYMVRVIKTIREYEGVDEEELKRKLLERKLKEAYRELIEKLKRNSLITIVDREVLSASQSP